MSYPGNQGPESQPSQFQYLEPAGGYQPPQQPAPVHEQPGYPQSGPPEPAYQYSPGHANPYGYGDAPTAPAGQPTLSMPPMSGPPASGPPISGPPVSGMPLYGLAQPAPAGPKRSPAVPILAAVAVLLLLAAGVMTGLFVTKNNALAAANSTIKKRDSTISDRDTELTRLKSDLEIKSAALDKAQQDLRGTQNESDKNKHDKQTVSTCLQLLLDALNAAGKGDKATFDKKLKDMKTPCDEAEVIMKT